jgi:hypothetical protein
VSEGLIETAQSEPPKQIPEAPGKVEVKISVATDKMPEGTFSFIVNGDGTYTVRFSELQDKWFNLSTPLVYGEVGFDEALENGAAIKINSVAALPHKLERLLEQPERLERLRQNAKSLGRPRAAFDVAGAALASAKNIR